MASSSLGDDSRLLAEALLTGGRMAVIIEGNKGLSGVSWKTEALASMSVALCWLPETSLAAMITATVACSKLELWGL